MIINIKDNGKEIVIDTENTTQEASKNNFNLLSKLKPVNLTDFISNGLIFKASGSSYNDYCILLSFSYGKLFLLSLVDFARVFDLEEIENLATAETIIDAQEIFTSAWNKEENSSFQCEFKCIGKLEGLV